MSFNLWITLFDRIHNKGAADVPVCVIICTKSADRRCFAITDSAIIDCEFNKVPGSISMN